MMQVHCDAHAQTKAIAPRNALRSIRLEDDHRLRARGHDDRQLKRTMVRGDGLVLSHDFPAGRETPGQEVAEGE